MIEVSASIIEDEQGRLLIASRSILKAQGRTLEFPGGKLVMDESPEEFLRREFLEEMGISIMPYTFFTQNDHSYGSTYFLLTAPKSTYVGGTNRLVNHDDYGWVYRKELAEYTFAPADI